jgi:hypothetical protein
MAFTNYTIVPVDGVVVLDGIAYQPVDMTGIPVTVHALVWNGVTSTGQIQYKQLPDGTLPAPGTFSDPADYFNQTEACESPLVCYSTSASSAYGGKTYAVGQQLTIFTWPNPAVPSGFTADAPPTVPQGQTLNYYSSAWVVSSFDPSLTLPQAKSSLINTVRANGATAVDAEVGLYSAVQLIDAPVVGNLETKTYPGTTLGEYQTYVDGVVSSATATINAAGSTAALYSFNPADLPFTPTASGILSTGRGGDGDGPLDLNNSFYTQFNSTTLTESETELYVPGTSTVISYGSIPNGFTSNGNCFTTGNYTVQIRQAATGFVLAEFECPLATVVNVDVEF